MSWVRDTAGKPRRWAREMRNQSTTNRVIGHVLGLVHEHQRPDTLEHRKFDCRALSQYAKAESLVGSINTSGEPAFTPDLSHEEMMNLVLVLSSPYGCLRAFVLQLITSCGSDNLAEKYFPQVRPYLPRSEQAPRFRASEKFDYNYIMIYNSYIGRAPDMQRWPLLIAQDELLYTGGNKDPNLAGPSPMDIERVAKLYPRQIVAPQQAPGGQPGKQVAKRWHSIKPSQYAGQPRPWPASCNGYTYIHYCYEDVAAFNALSGLFAEGLDIWKPATRESSLVFRPDPSCQTSPCFCSTRDVAEVTVHIALTRDPTTWPSSTHGYRDPGFPRIDPDRARHSIQWPRAPVDFGDQGRVYMAQQLGENPSRNASKMAEPETSITH